MEALLDLPHLRIIATLVMVVMASSVIFIRLKASRRPVTIKKIIMPPIGMSTGALMFVVPEFHIPIIWGLIAFVVGWFLFSYPLIRTTHFEIINDEVYAQRSPGFAFILIGLLAVRLILHEVIEQYISVLQTGSLFFLLAFGMIINWRLFMLKKYREITDKPIN